MAAATTNNPRDRKLVTWAGVLPVADGMGLIPAWWCAWVSGGEITLPLLPCAHHHLLLHGWPGAIFIAGLLALGARKSKMADVAIVSAHFSPAPAV